MKTTNALLAFFFFLSLFALIKADHVRDSRGLIVSSAFNYFLLPTNLGGEAIVGAATGNIDEHCSLAVVKDLSNDKGWSTKFSLIGDPSHHDHLIDIDDPIGITFDPLPSNPCTFYPNWLVIADKEFGQDVVVVGPPNLQSGAFFFKPYDNKNHHYTLTFCSNSENCGHVSVMNDDTLGKKRLIVTNDQEVEPFVFKIVLKGIFEASDISMVV